MSLKRGVCKICGCTDRNACYTDEQGACWWIDEQHTICSHCYYGWNKEKMRNKNSDDEQLERSKDMNAKQTIIFTLASITVGFIASGVVIWQVVEMIIK